MCKMVPGVECGMGRRSLCMGGMGTNVTVRARI